MVRSKQPEWTCPKCQGWNWGDLQVCHRHDCNGKRPSSNPTTGGQQQRQQQHKATNSTPSTRVELSSGGFVMVGGGKKARRRAIAAIRKADDASNAGADGPQPNATEEKEGAGSAQVELDELDATITCALKHGLPVDALKKKRDELAARDKRSKPLTPGQAAAQCKSLSEKLDKAARQCPGIGQRA